MIGAAIGIPRGDERLPRIASDFALALRVDEPGVRAYDYHTVSSPDASKAKAIRPRTREQELSLNKWDDLNTTITRREYIQGARYQIFIVQLRWIS